MTKETISFTALVRYNISALKHRKQWRNFHKASEDSQASFLSLFLLVSEVSGLVVLEVDFIGLAVFTWPDYQVWFPLQV